MRSDPEVQQVADTFHLGLPRTPVAGRSGELLGRGTGSSLEFQEYREYAPGDDVRHIDWAAYGRSDHLMIRLYREEISPRTEIFLDATKSMTTGGGAKARIARQLAAVFALLSGRLGGRPTITLLDDRRPLQPLGVEALEVLERVPFTATRNLAELLAERSVPMKPQAVRIVVSDFLFPHEPDALVRSLAAGAGALWMVQVLGAWEANPTPLGGRRLIDSETSAETNLVVGGEVIAEYRARLRLLQEELARSCRRAGATFATVIAERGLLALCRDELILAGMLQIR